MIPLRRRPTAFLAAWLVAFLYGASCAAALPGDASPSLPDLLKAVREHVRDSSVPERSAAQALLEGVQGTILGPGELGEPPSDAPAIARKERLEGGALYVRVGQVSLALAPQLAAILRDTNLLSAANGLVLDLRFASGSEYSAAAHAADLLAQPGTPLLDWGNGPMLATPKDRAWELPVAVLVNRETRGAAEALAAAIRSANAGLLIGSATAGKAAIFREIPLPDGLRLRLATAPVRTGDGSALPAAGITPDISVRTVASHDRAYLEDPYAVIGPSSGPEAGRVTNTVTVKRRLTEADLVRQRRGETNTPAAAPAAQARVIRDPALARAVDLLRGLAALKPAAKDDPSR